MKPFDPLAPPLCGCGCGGSVTRKGHARVWNAFILHHHARVQPTGERAYRWKGGEVRTVHGYVMVKSNHPRANEKGYVRRSMLVAEYALGRSLQPGEVVHHRNQIRHDDRPENLEVLASQSAHIALHNRSIRRAKVLTEESVREIKRLLATQSRRSIARQFGVGSTTVCSIANGEYWRWVTV